MRRNINLIKRDLEFAADVMRRLPPIKMQQVRSSWPRLVYTADELEAQKPLPVYFHPKLCNLNSANIAQPCMQNICSL